MKEYIFELVNNSAVAKTIALLAANFNTLNPGSNVKTGTKEITTSAAGEASFAHNLLDKNGNGVTPVAAFVNVRGDNANLAKVLSVDDTNIDVLLVDAAGADVAATVTVDYVVFTSKRVDMFNDASEIVEAGYTADYAADDGVLFEDGTGQLILTPSDQNKTYRTFRREIMHGGKMLRGIRIDANSETALQEKLIFERVGIIDENTRKKTILMKNKIDPNQQSQTVALIKPADLDAQFGGYPLDSETILTMPVKAGASFTVTLQFDD